MQHMYSILVVRSRVPISSSCETKKDFVSLEHSAFLPTPLDIKAIQANLILLVLQVIAKYVNACTCMLVLCSYNNVKMIFISVISSVLDST